MVLWATVIAKSCSLNVDPFWIRKFTVFKTQKMAMIQTIQSVVVLSATVSSSCINSKKFLNQIFVWTVPSCKINLRQHQAQYHTLLGKGHHDNFTTNPYSKYSINSTISLFYEIICSFLNKSHHKNYIRFSTMKLNSIFYLKKSSYHVLNIKISFFIE